MIMNLIRLIPVIGYYLVESFLLAVFTLTAWKYFLTNIFSFDINYLQWVAIIFIIKICFFDIFKTPHMQGKNNTNNSHNND